MMDVTINWMAILYSVIAAMVIGAVWYGVFSEAWLKAVGKKKEDLKEGQTMGYVISTITALVGAYILTHFIAYAGAANPESTGAMLGATTAFWGWLGFVVPYALMATAWEGRSWNLFWLNMGHQLLTLVVMGMILASMM
ncbi:DUF1761 domain-containing protein [Candidatus Berkelbacteria bacterium]|nr:DUF1761 domain-containing protein [Candidatus Berkelbacteria bacterium]